MSIDVLLIVLGFAIGWLIGLLMKEINKHRVSRKIKKTMADPKYSNATTYYVSPITEHKEVEKKSTKERIEQVLPETPLGCMWVIEQNTRHYVKVFVQKENEAHGIFDAERLWNDNPLFSDYDDRMKYYVNMAKLQLVDNDGVFQTTEFDVPENDDNKKELLNKFKMASETMLRRYVNQKDEWNGVIIKNA